MSSARQLVPDRLIDAVGGPARLRVITLLSGALALAAADQTIAGAVAPDMKVALGVDNTGIGLLVTAASLMSGVTTLPFGLLADRVTRVRLLAGCVLVWTVALVLEGAAQTYSMLLVAQILLGAGVGAATPVVASLAGDLFPNVDRGRALGFILAGEFAGAASGLVLAGEVAAVWSWRGSFWVVAATGPVFAVVLVRMLPEPIRGGAGAVQVGDTQLGTNGLSAARPAGDTASAPDPPEARPARTGLAEAVERAGIAPHRDLVLRSDPAGRSLSWAVRYVLSIRTNVVIIVASALGYFYVAGMQTFAIVYVRGRFDVGQGVATLMLVFVGLAVIIGTLATGQLSDRLIGRGHVAGRPVVGALCFLLAVAVLIPGFALATFVVAVPLLLVGAAALGGMNPPLDAARLDIMHSRLWGRAESVRNFFQTLLKSGAPLAFGYLSTVLAGSGATEAAQGGGAVGLNRAFLVLLAVLVLGGLVLLVARRTYPRDVATAMASEEATRS